MTTETSKNTSEIIGDIITVANKQHFNFGTTYQTPHINMREISNESTLQVDFNRAFPMRVRDLSIVSSRISNIDRYSSPVTLTFHERPTRHKFVRNVFAVLTLQFFTITTLCLGVEFV